MGSTDGNTTDGNTKARYPKRRIDTAKHTTTSRSKRLRATHTPKRGLLAFKPAVECPSTDVLLVHFNVAEAMATGSKSQGSIISQQFVPLADCMMYKIVDESPKLPLKIKDGEAYVTVCGVLKKVKLIAFNAEGEEWKTFAKHFQNALPTAGGIAQVDTRTVANNACTTANDACNIANNTPTVSDISPHELEMIQAALRQYRKKDESLSKSTQTAPSLPPRPPAPHPHPHSHPHPHLHPHPPPPHISPSTSKSPKLIGFANRLKSLAETLHKATEVLSRPVLQDLEEMFDVDWMVEDMDKMVTGVIGFQNGTGGDGKKRWRSGGKNEKQFLCRNDSTNLDPDGESHRPSTAVPAAPATQLTCTSVGKTTHASQSIGKGVGKSLQVTRSTRAHKTIQVPRSTRTKAIQAPTSRLTRTKATQALNPSADPIIVSRVLTRQQLAAIPVKKATMYLDHVNVRTRRNKIIRS